MPHQEQGTTESTACLGVIMPLYNEVRTLEAIATKVLEQPRVQELIVVDDASNDGSWELLQRLSKADPRIRPFRHPANAGKGAALRTGFQYCTSKVMLVQDADLEYDPQEYTAMIAPILSGRADVVFGSRFIGSGAHRVLYFWHYLGNKLLTLLSNMATNLNLTDMECCYKAFRREAVEKIYIEENRFGFEPEITAKVARLNLRIYEVAISYHGRTYAEGKKINWRDGASALRCIFVYNFLR